MDAYLLIYDSTNENCKEHKIRCSISYSKKNNDYSPMKYNDLFNNKYIVSNYILHSFFDKNFHFNIPEHIMEKEPKLIEYFKNKNVIVQQIRDNNIFHYSNYSYSIFFINKYDTIIRRYEIVLSFTKPIFNV